MIIFDSVRFLSKKLTKPNFFKKKTETEPQPGQTDRFRFGFLGQKPVQTDLARFSRFWLGFPVFAWFFRFGSVFLVWLGFFSGFFSFGSVFWFFAYETEPNRLVF